VAGFNSSVATHPVLPRLVPDAGQSEPSGRGTRNLLPCHKAV